MASLKNEIIGSWRLLSYIEIPVGGEEYLFPLGNKPKGILIFSPDGFMSVQITVHTANLYDSDDRYSVSDNKIADRAKGYIAFSGSYTVDNILSRVNYNIETSLHPNWEGQNKVRKLDFEGNIMYQKSLEPILSNGQFVHAYMTWQRIDKRIDGEGPQEEMVGIAIKKEL